MTKHWRQFFRPRAVDSDLANSGGSGRADGVDRASRRADADERLRPGDAQPFRSPQRRQRAAHGRFALADVRRAADPDGSHPLIVESGLAQPTLTIPPGDYVVHVAFGLASAAKRVTLGAEVRSERLDPLGGRAPDRRHPRRRADRPFQAVARDLRAAEPQSAGQARLRQSAKQAISSDCRKAPIISSRPISTRSAPIRASARRAFRRNRRCSRRLRRSRPIRSSTPISRSPPASGSTSRFVIAARR